MGEVVEAEAHELPDEPGAELAVIDPRVAATLFGTHDPEEIVRRASAHATQLAAVVEQKRLFNVIQGKKHVQVEGWTLLGSMLGVFAVPDGEPEPVEIFDTQGFKASMKAQTLDGQVVGGATGYCMRNESRWKNADIYAVAGMAQTRATSRALRQPLGFIMQLAGYSATPDEEMPRESPDQPAPASAQISKATLTKLRTAMKKLEAKPEWQEESLLATGSKLWGRKIERLEDFTEDEGKMILQSMKERAGV